MEDNRLWFLIARQLSGEITAIESNELQESLQRHPDKQHLFDILHAYFSLHHDSKEGDVEALIDYETRFRSIIEQSEYKNDRISSPEINPGIIRSPFKWWQYAAIVACIVALAGAGFYYFYRPKIEIENIVEKSNEIISKSGARTKLMLPDGSQVWLNSGSKLTYSNTYNKNTREVELEGEAYFDVAKDLERPFIVHASSLNIKAVGTAFVVKSYPQDETVETTLLRGIIEVSRKDYPDGSKVILKPNEKLVFSKHLENGVPQKANTVSGHDKIETVGKISVAAVSKTIPDSNKVETSWVYNRLVFDGDSFQELAEKMERWYNVKINFKSNELFHYRFKGAFANETVKEALNALQLTANFSYQINNNEINLYKK
jgi:transmembrane sensor